MHLCVLNTQSSVLTWVFVNEQKKKEEEDEEKEEGEKTAMVMNEKCDNTFEQYKEFFSLLEEVQSIPIKSFVIIAVVVVFVVFLWQHPWHMEVPRLGVELELLLPAYATATVMPDPSHVWDLHHSSQKHHILNPLSEARDQTFVLIDTSRVRNPLCCNGNSYSY